MRYQEWMTLTARTGKPRSSELKAVDTALFDFSQSGLKTDLIILESALDAWKTSKFPRDWRASIRNTHPSGKRPVETLSRSIAERKSQFAADEREVVDELARAARVVRDKYRSAMEDGYASALEATFISPVGQTRCYKRYKSREAWSKHTSGARTSDHDVRETDRVTAVTPTLLTTRETYGSRNYRPSRNLAGISPPLNRRIEFFDVEHHTLVHEMLHWCCHETFRIESSKQSLGDEFELVLEGWTEWLARNALGKWNEGGYLRIMLGVIAAVKAGQPKPDALVAAYFKGIQVTNTALMTIKYISTEHSNEKLAKTGQNQEIARVLDLMKGKLRRAPETATEDFKGMVANAFKGDLDVLLTEHAELNNYPGWVTFLRKGKTVNA
jgi:hypothetical protein